MTVWYGMWLRSFFPRESIHHPSSIPRSFYEDLPDLLSTVPPNLLGLTEDQAEQLREEERRKQKEERSAIDGDDAAATGDDEEPSSAGGAGEGAGGGEGEGGDDELLLVEEMKGLAVAEGEEGGDKEKGDGEGAEEVSKHFSSRRILHTSRRFLGAVTSISPGFLPG